MIRFKRILRRCKILTLMLVAGFLLPVSAQSQELKSLTATAKGQGVIASAVDEQEINSALVVLRQNGTLLIAIYADVQLQAQGTWSTSASSPEEILLKITGGVLKGEMTGPGKLLLTSDRKSFKELTMKVKLTDGQEVAVTFVADAAEPPVENMKRGALHETRFGLPASTHESRIRVLKINKKSVSLS